MIATRRGIAVGVLAGAWLAATGASAASPEPQGKDGTIAQRPPAKQVAPRNQKPPQPPPAPAPRQWSKSEVEEERIRCAALLRGVRHTAAPEMPLRDGNCGAAGPIRLISVGSKPEVVFNPPAFVSCDMVKALAEWVETGVQPLARKHLGRPVMQIEVMSDYSCRRAYGRKNGKLSEHARANALDIRGFVTTGGQTAGLMADWGPTARDIRIQAAAAERAKAAAASKQAAAALPRAQNSKAATGPGSAPAAAGSDAALVAGSLGVAPAAPATVFTGFTAGNPRPLDGPDMGPGSAQHSPLRLFSRSLMPTIRTNDAGQIARLGGPKQPGGRAAADQTRRAMFLRATHASACKIFGTTLGPEVNYAHRNHFHVDMAMRRNALKICE